MFSKKLSSSVLSICDSRDLSYEAASELCDLSSRYFGSIARGKTSPHCQYPGKALRCIRPNAQRTAGFLHYR